MSENDPLPDHTDSEEDAKGDDKDSDDLIEAVHPLAQRISDRATSNLYTTNWLFTVPDKKRNMPTAALKHPQRMFMDDLPRVSLRE